MIHKKDDRGCTCRECFIEIERFWEKNYRYLCEIVRPIEMNTRGNDKNEESDTFEKT